jgi:hypothetical protein
MVISTRVRAFPGKIARGLYQAHYRPAKTARKVERSGRREQQGQERDAKIPQRQVDL